MLNKFNIVTLKLMNILKTMLKMMVVSFIILSFFSSIVQTTTHFRVIMEGTYGVDPNLGTSGKAFLYNGAESILYTGGGYSIQNLEASEESCEMWDAWGGGGGGGGWGCSPSGAYRSFPDYDPHQDALNSLSEDGISSTIFEPTSANPIQNNFYLAFKGSGNGIYFAYFASGEWLGLGMYLVVVPAIGHKIDNIKIQTWSGGTFMEFSGNEGFTTGCNGSKCNFKFSDNFFYQTCGEHHQNSWQKGFGYVNNSTLKYTNVREYGSFSCRNISRSSIPDNELHSADGHIMMPVYSLGTYSYYRSSYMNHVTGSWNWGTQYNLWGRVWESIETNKPNLYLDLTTSRSSAYSAPTPRLSKSSSGDYYHLSSSYSRSQLPVILGLTWDNHLGFLGTENNAQDADFRIYITFAQLGHKINAVSIPGVASISSVFQLNTPGKTLNLREYAHNTFETVTLGGSDAFCINEASVETSIDIDTPPGVVPTTRNNITTFPLALGESYIDSVTMNIHYKYILQVTTPNFSVSRTPDDDTYGTIGIGQYIRSSWVPANGILLSDLRANNQDFYNKTCSFLNYYQEVNIAPESFRYIKSVTTTNVTLYTSDSGASYETFNPDQVLYKATPVKVYAKVTNLSDPHVRVEFDVFPKIKFMSFIGSTLLDNVVPSRHVLLQGSDTMNAFFEYYIQANNDGPTGIDAVKITIDPRLERLFIYNKKAGLGNGDSIGVFTNKSDPKNNITGVDPTILDILSEPLDSATQVRPLPGAGATQNISSNDASYKLARLLDQHYELTISDFTEDLYIYIDFVPFTFSIFAKEDLVTTINNVTDGACVKILNDAGSCLSPLTNVINTTSNITLKENEVVSFNVGIDRRSPFGGTLPPYHFLNYYIYELIENDNGITAESQLMNLDASFLTLEYFSQPAVTNSVLVVGVERYKTVKLEFPVVPGNVGRAVLDLDSLVDKGNTTNIVVEYSSTGGVLHTVLPNTVIDDFGTPFSVGVRRYDNAKFYLLPNPGYYVKSVKKIIDINNDDIFGEASTTVNGIVTISSPDKAKLLGEGYLNLGSGRELMIEKIITYNMKLDIIFAEKPSIRSFWLGVGH